MILYKRGTTDYINMAKFGYVKPKSVSELKAYEASLKERDLPAFNHFKAKGKEIRLEADPYNLCDKFKMIIAYVDGKQERGEPVNEEDLKEAEEAKQELKLRMDAMLKQRAEARGDDSEINAKNMLDEGKSLEEVAKATGVSMSNLQKLADNVCP